MQPHTISSVNTSFAEKAASVAITLALIFSVVPLPAQAIVYEPGATLDPSCLPTDPNCFVQAPITGTTATSTFKTPIVAEDTIVLAPTSTPASLANRLYNVGSVLYWNGGAVSGVSGLVSLNGLASSTQLFMVGTSGTDFGITSSGNTHTFNLPNASSIARGLLSSGDWTTFTNKQDTIVAGGVGQYYRGDKSFQTLDTSVVPENGNLYYTDTRFDTRLATKNTAQLAEGTNLYYTDTRARNALSVAGPLGYDSGTGLFSLSQASSTGTGYLSSADWNTFTNKVASVRQVLAGSGLSGGGDLTLDRTLSLDITGLTAKSNPLAADELAVYDTGLGLLRKMSRSDFLQGLTSALIYQGIWDANTNTPTLADGVGAGGSVYVAGTASTTVDLGSGALTINSGDFVIYNASTTAWEVAPSGSQVATVFGRTGNVVASNGDYAAAQITNATSTNLASALTVQSALNALANGKLTSLGGLTAVTQTFAANAPTGLTLAVNSSGSTHTLDLALASGYNIPLTASSTNWNNFYNTPSSRIAAGGGLSWNTNSIALNITDLASKGTPLSTDEIAVYDSTVGGVRKMTRSNFLQGLTSALTYQGTWNANTNTPLLSDGAGVAGQTYAVTVASSTVNLGSGVQNAIAGDFIIYNGSSAAWEVAPSGSMVTGVFGRTGAILAQAGDYSASQITNATSTYLPSATTVQSAIDTIATNYLTLADWNATTTSALAEGTNLYYTDARARSSLSTTALGLTYTTATGILALDAGYNIPLTASTTERHNFYITPSTRITAGTGLSWSGNTLINNAVTSLASLTVDGSISTTTQSFAGAKTFAGNLAASAAFSVAGNATLATTSASVLSANTLSIGSLGGLLFATAGTVGTTSLTTLTANILASSGNVVTSNVNGVTSTTTAVNSVALSTTTNTFAASVNGVASAFANVINSLASEATGNILTTTVNGISATSSIITSNTLDISGISLTSTVNGVATTTDLPYASLTLDGVVSTTTQSFAGAKTFTGATTALDGLTANTITATSSLISQGTLSVASNATLATTSITQATVSGILSLGEQSPNSLIASATGFGKVFAKAATGSGVDKYVQLLIHADDIAGTTSFRDSSNDQVAITNIGTTTITNTNAKFGTGALEFNGTSQYLTTSNGSAYDFLNQTAFTVDLWFNASSTSAIQPLITYGDAPNNNWQLRMNGTAVQFVHDNTVRITGGSVTASTWHHIALVRYGTNNNENHALYLDGVSVGTVTIDTDVFDNSLYIASDNSFGSNFFGGRMDEIRVSPGIRRYSANFTPEGSPYGTGLFYQLANGSLVELAGGGAGGSGSTLDVGAWHKTGDTFSATSTLGTLDAFGLQLVTGGVNRLVIDAAGSVAIGGQTSLATTTASSLSASSLSVGSLSGLLFGTAGSVGTIATSTLGLITTSVAEGTNLYYTDARARNALGSTATGLSYATSTGVISLTAGYNIPLTASTTNWNGFYDDASTRILAGTGLAWSATNTLSVTSAPVVFASTTADGIISTTTQSFAGDKTFTGSTVLATTSANVLLLRELATNGTNYIGFKAPDSLTTNTIFSLPDGDGASGQILRTDGLGTLSWVSSGISSVSPIIPKLMKSNGNANGMIIIYRNQLIGWGHGAGTAPYGSVAGNEGVPQILPVENPPSDWKEAVGNYYSYCALSTAGDVYCGGRNAESQLGDGTTVARSYAKKVTFPGTANTIASIYTNRHQSGSSESYFAIDTDGELYAWGDNGWGQLGDGSTTNRNTPVRVGVSGALGAPLTGKVITSVSVAGSTGTHVAAIDSTGQLYTWGYNTTGALGIGNTTQQTVPQVTSVTNAAEVIAAASYYTTANYAFTVVRKTDGTLVAAGRNAEGQLGDGTTAQKTAFVAVAGISGSTKIVAGFWNAASINASGNVSLVGDNGHYQLGDGTATNRSSYYQPAGGFQGKVAKVIIGSGGSNNTYIYILDSDGEVWSAGNDDYGQLARGYNGGTAPQRGTFTKAIRNTNGKKVVDMLSYGNHSNEMATLILLEDGTMMTVGRNNYKQLGTAVNEQTDYTTSFGYVLGFDPGSKSANATIGDQLAFNQLQGAATSNTLDNTAHAQTWNWSTLTGGNGLALSANALTSGKGLSVLSSSNNLGATGALTHLSYTGSSTVGSILRTDTSVVGGGSFMVDTLGRVGIGAGISAPSVTLDVAGTAQLRGSNALRFADVDSSNYISFQAPTMVASNVTYTLPDADGTSGQMLSTDGLGALSWATASGGGFSSVSPFIPKLMKSNANANGQIIIYRNQLIGWGQTTSGSPYGFEEYTDGTPKIMPVQNPPSNWKEVVGNLNNYCALSTGGDVYCAGSNAHGQLGDNTTTARPVAEKITFPVDASAIASIYTTTYYLNDVTAYYALDVDGKLYAWGDNTWGQLGDGTSGTDRKTPVRVGVSGALGVPLTNKVITNVSVSSQNGTHVAAIDSTGQLYTWGYNGAGNLGIGSAVNQSVPQVITGVTNAAEVFASGGSDTATNLNFTVVRKTDGTIVSAGRNTEGQLGDGSTTGSQAFVPASSISNVTKIFTGGVNSAAIDANNDVYLVGRNNEYQLGDGTLTNRTTYYKPAGGFQGKATKVVFGGSPGHSAVYTAYNFIYILDSDGEIWSAGTNDYGYLARGYTNGTASQRGTFTKAIRNTNGKKVVDILTYGYGGNQMATIIVLEDGTMMTVGRNDTSQLGVTVDDGTLRTSVFRYVLGFDPGSKVGNATIGDQLNFNQMQGAAMSNTLDNATSTQTWNWSAVTSGNALVLSANALTTGKGLSVQSSSNNLLASGALAHLSYTGSSTAGSILRIDNNASSTSPFVVDVNGNVGIGTSTPTAQFHTTGTVRLSNFGAGTLTTDASGNVTAASDARIKTDYAAFERGLESILGLTPASYKWTDGSGLETEHSYTGFVAQNVADFVPEAVGVAQDGTLTLSDRPILAALVNAAKELNSKSEIHSLQIGKIGEIVGLTTDDLNQIKLDYLAGKAEETDTTFAELKSGWEQLRADYEEQKLSLASLASTTDALLVNVASVASSTDALSEVVAGMATSTASTAPAEDPEVSTSTDSVIENVIDYIATKLTEGITVAEEFVVERIVAATGWFDTIFSNRYCAEAGDGETYCLSGEDIKQLGGAKLNDEVDVNTNTEKESAPEPAVEPDPVPTPEPESVTEATTEPETQPEPDIEAPAQSEVEEEITQTEPEIKTEPVSEQVTEAVEPASE